MAVFDKSEKREFVCFIIFIRLINFYLVLQTQQYSTTPYYNPNIPCVCVCKEISNK